MNKNELTSYGILTVIAILACGCVERKLADPAIPPATQQQQVTAGEYDYTPKVMAETGQIKKRVAVAPFSYSAPVAERGLAGPEVTFPFSRRFTEKLIHELHRSKRFIVVERRNIGEILKELDFQGTDYVDKTTSEKIGNILGVEVIVTGAFDLNDRDVKFWTDREKEWNGEDRDRRLRLEQMVAAQTRGEVIAQTDRQYRMKRLQELRDAYDEAPPPGSLYLRLYEVGTSRVVDSVRVEGETETELLKRAVRKLSRSIDKIPWAGKIADVEGDTVYINAGRTVGVRKGDEFTVISLGREITDPESGKIIGYTEQEVGLVVVDTVQEKISRAKIARGMGVIKEGDTIQLAEPSP